MISTGYCRGMDSGSTGRILGLDKQGDTEMETVYKITAYPINPAYRPRVVLVRDDDPAVAKKKADDAAREMRESFMPGQVDLVDCRDVTPIRLSEFLDAHSALEKAEEKMVKEILGPAFRVPAPFGEGQFVIRAARNTCGAYCVEGSWYAPGADEDPCGTWNFEITAYPSDPCKNCVEIDWPGPRMHRTATLDPDDVTSVVTNMVRRSREQDYKG